MLTQYCRNVRENRIKKSKNLLKSLRKCSLKMSTNYRIIGKIESKKNVRRGGIMREIKEARYLHETNRIE